MKESRYEIMLQAYETVPLKIKNCVDVKYDSH